MILWAIVPVLLTGAVAFCATRLLYRGEAVKLRVAVVMEEENSLTQLAFDYVQKTEEEVEFVVCSRTEAFAGLENNRYSAVIILAKQLIEGILDGENPQVLVVCNKNLVTESSVLKELTRAGATMLSTAQAEIYAVYALSEEVGVQSGWEDFQNTINTENLGLVMGRSGLFQYKEVSATGNLSIKMYYAASAFTAILLFFSMPMGMFLKQDNEAVLKSYKRMEIGAIGQQTVRFLTVMGIYGALLLAGAVILSVIGKGAAVFPQKDILQITGSFLEMWLVAGSMSAFILMIYELVEKKSSAVFLLAFLTVFFLFLSGAILPKVFLPVGLRKVGELLPSGFWLSSMGAAIAGEEVGKSMLGSILYGIVFFAAAVWCRKQEH